MQNSTNKSKENKKKIGVWIEKYELDSIEYRSIGKYKNGEPIKKWKYYANGVITKKERYKKNKCLVSYYFPNGEIQSKGKTKLVISTTETHWFYFGNWKYYDENGMLANIRKYANGELVFETKNKLTINHHTIKKLIAFILIT